MVMIGEKLWGTKLLGPVSCRGILAYQCADSFAAKASTFARALARKRCVCVCFGAKAV